MDDKKLDLNAPLLSVRRLSNASSSLGLRDNSPRKTKPSRQQSLPVSKSKWEPEQEDTKPAAVPFLWEQAPGKAKPQEKPISQPPKENSYSPRFPSQEKSSSSPSNVKSSSEEDAYADAVETLSSASFSWNWSDENADVDSSGSFSSDLQTRDYLMNRFLPAAKSMIVETPQYVTKKQEPVVEITEPPKYVKKVYSGELRPLLLENYPVPAVSPYHHTDSEDESEDFEGSKKKLGKKSCGFFLPRICVKNSLCLLNSLPDSDSKPKIHESQSPAPYSPVQVPRMSRRTSYSGPLTPSFDKQAMDAVIRRRAESRPREVHGTQIRLSPLNHSSESFTLDRSSSPHRGSSRSGRISPYRNESPRSPFHDGARFLGMPKDLQNQTVQPKTCPSLNVKSHFSPRLISTPVSPQVAEKTLYVDWVEPPRTLTPQDIKVDKNEKQENRVKVEMNEKLDALEVPFVPPLPKSPTESWLWRTMTLKSPFPKKVQQDSQVDKSPKWETIVKTSNVHHDHIRYSEELLHVSQHSDGF